MKIKKSDIDDPDLGTSKKVTGRELSIAEEVSIRLETLVDILHEKGIINKREYQSRVVMRLHELSKASAFEEMDEEI
jgi:hypothetical protein